MILQLDLQVGCEADYLPDHATCRQWVKVALEKAGFSAKKVDMTIRTVDTAESAHLNQTYRQKAGPTNILSFPFDIPSKKSVSLLGDLIICAPLVVQEASAQHKELRAYWAHLIVHGTLHLLAYDHQAEEQAIVMEKLETIILKSLGFAP